MRLLLSASAAMLLAIGSITPALAAIPNLVGNWVAGPDDWVVSGAGVAASGWSNLSGPTNKLTKKPTIVFEQQNGRQFTGYLVTPSGQHDPFHGMIKPSGSGLTARNGQGIISADLHGNTMDWCWASTAANMDYVACNQLRRAGK